MRDSTAVPGASRRSDVIGLILVYFVTMLVQAATVEVLAARFLSLPIKRP
jgi:hypothetical protein